MSAIEVTNDSPPAQVKGVESAAHPTEDVDIISTQGLPQEMSAAEEPIKSSMDVITDDISSPIIQQNISSYPVKTEKNLLEDIEVPLNSIARITSEEASSTQVESKQQSAERRLVMVQSKPIPPSLRGNSPFIEPTISTNKTDNPVDGVDLTTQKPVEKESHEVFRESKADITIQPEKQDGKQVNFPPLSVYKVNSDRDPDESSSRVGEANTQLKDGVENTNTLTASTPVVKIESNDTKFFTRVIGDEAITTVKPTPTTKSKSKPNTENDFFVVTETPIRIVETSSTKASSKEVYQLSTTKTMTEVASAKSSIDDLNKSAALSSDQEMAEEAEPEAPERPNRGRLLIKPQHHSFYPYFLNRVLG